MGALYCFSSTGEYPLCHLGGAHSGKPVHCIAVYAAEEAVLTSGGDGSVATWQIYGNDVEGSLALSIKKIGGDVLPGIRSHSFAISSD